VWTYGPPKVKALALAVPVVLLLGQVSRTAAQKNHRSFAATVAGVQQR
jgi:hypothetical protein